MKKKCTKIITMMLALTMIFSCFVGMDVKASNPYATFLDYNSKKTLVLVKNKMNNGSNYLEMGKKVDGRDSVKVSSSKKSVLKASKETFTSEDGIKYIMIHVKPQKAGTATVTVKVKKSGATKYKTYKQKIKVVNYANPFKTIKLNGKSIKKTFNKDMSYSNNKKYSSAKLEVKAAKNWKIKSLKYIDLYKNNINATKKYKNKTKITIPKGLSTSFIIVMKNSKTGAEQEFSIYVSNDN